MFVCVCVFASVSVIEACLVETANTRLLSVHVVEAAATIFTDCEAVVVAAAARILAIKVVVLTAVEGILAIKMVAAAMVNSHCDSHGGVVVLVRREIR